MKSAYVLLITALLPTTAVAVVAQPEPQQYYGIGGQITGYILGVNRQPLDWAAVYATDNEHTFQAFSGMSGGYTMRVPAGRYNVTVYVPGYEASSKNATVTVDSFTNLNFYLSIKVAVSGGSSSSINFYLNQTQVPVAESKANRPLIFSILTLAAAVILRIAPRMNRLNRED
jgi:hypothetical protein